jgi:hypothetical protein
VALDQKVERLRAATLGLTGEGQIVLPGLVTQAHLLGRRRGAHVPVNNRECKALIASHLGDPTRFAAMVGPLPQA